MPKVLVALGLAAMLAMPTSAFAADHQVLMLNKDSEGRPMQFEPAFLKVAPGDTVTFVPQGKINEQITVTFSVEGFYAYRCLPHFALGMVGLIQVGETATVDAAALTDKLPGKAKTRMEELIAEAQEH